MRIARAAPAALLLAALCISVSSAQAEGPTSKNQTQAQFGLLKDRWSALLGGDDSGIRDRPDAEIGLPGLQQSLQRISSQKPDENHGDGADPAEIRGSNSTAIFGRSERFAEVLLPLEAVSDSRIILDISPEPSEYIPGAVGISYTEFIQSGGALKNSSEIAAILGEAGISRDDSVLIYGECQPCGGGPSAAAYVYWIMKYLGHENLTLLDGGIDDWVAAGRPTASNPAHLHPVNYTPGLNAGFLAEYDLVKGGYAQIIDARTASEFEAGSIPGSINIPYDAVLDDKLIKDPADLEQLFSFLDAEKPVIVYTNTGVKASMVWLALSLLGYEAQVYSWKEWQSAENATSKYKNSENR
jgi:thiosulfate/3-mercaptopyruvate sulfurtransferase